MDVDHAAAGGMLVLTSCNFASEELDNLLEESRKFKRAGGLAYPTIEFGGKRGSRVVSQAFRRI
eukprot:766441-Hanusia_phi.AAC.4